MKLLTRKLLGVILSFLFFISFYADAKRKELKKEEFDKELAIKWSKMTLDCIQRQPNKSPTFVSRTLGYIGLTMYETVVNSSTKYQSIAHELNGFESLPKPLIGQKYDWEIALNAGQSKLFGFCGNH